LVFCILAGDLDGTAWACHEKVANVIGTVALVDAYEKVSEHHSYYRYHLPRLQHTVTRRDQW
jgi:hypothetical protein